MENKEKPWEIDDIVYFAKTNNGEPFSVPTFYRATVEQIHRDCLLVAAGTERANWPFVPREKCYPTLQALYDAMHAQMDVEYDRLAQDEYKNNKEDK